MRDLFTFQCPGSILLPHLPGDPSSGSRHVVLRFFGEVACEAGLIKTRIVLMSATKQLALCSLEVFSKTSD